MTVSVANTQREAPVDQTRIARLARRAARRMRTLNKRFLRHDWNTDVLSFRYDGEPVVGEILIAPRLARAYAAERGLPYEEELARYVVHGLLHWTGLDDRTPAQQRRMRREEDRLLQACGVS